MWRLHRCGEPQSERHWWQKGYPCCPGCWEEVLSLPSCLQTHGRTHGYTTSTKGTKSGLLSTLTSFMSYKVILIRCREISQVMELPLLVSSNWPTTLETPCQDCAVSCRVSSSRWKKRWKSLRTSVQMTQHAKPKPYCSGCIAPYYNNHIYVVLHEVE